MQEISDLWWVWLILIILFSSYTLNRLTDRIARMMNGLHKQPAWSFQGSFGLYLACILGALSLTLFTIAQIWMIYN